MKMFCEVKYRRRTKTTSSSTHSHATTFQDVAGKLYEEFELTNKDFPLNVSQNVSYQPTSKK